MQRESMEFDVVIVGAGPAGLSAAIELAQLNQKHKQALSICVLEKGAQVGAHILSGAVVDPSGLDKLIPDWSSKNAPLTVPVTKDHFYYFNSKKAYRLPTPPLMKNEGNYIISLGELCAWLGTQAEALGVSIFPGFTAAKTLIEDNTVIGVQTGDMGLHKNGETSDRFQAGINILAKQTVFAEGCRGSLTEQIIKQFNLRSKSNPQTYAIGIKELWKIKADQHKLGEVTHTIGWPLDSSTYGGGFIYHFKDQLLSIGLVIGLDYHNPYLDPFKELQRFKHHPSVQPLLEGGECIRYGARALNEGGLQSLPQLSFPGGVLVGCSAGMVNVGKIKGIHNAIKSGQLAANAIFESLTSETPDTQLIRYQDAFNQSDVYQELYRVRNLRPGFHRGLYTGLLLAGIDQYVFFGKAPWTLKNHTDHSQLKPAKQCHPIAYPKPDGKVSFDKLTQVYLTATKHREDEPCHLKLKNADLATSINLKKYGGPEQRYCPAGVYEFIEKDGSKQLQINFANCIHCKTCDIKDPEQNIVWTTPEGGDGPNYHLM